MSQYVEQVMTICRVQERQLSLSYFLSYFPLIVSDAILCPLHNLNTLWYIIIALYSYVEQVLRIVAYKNDNSRFHTLCWYIIM